MSCKFAELYFWFSEATAVQIVFFSLSLFLRLSFGAVYQNKISKSIDLVMAVGWQPAVLKIRLIYAH